MGKEFPKYPSDVADGDERAYSPHKTTDSLLATQRGTDFTRRLETDSERNLYVNIGKDTSKSIDLLYSASLSSIAANTPTAFVAYTAPSAKVVYKIIISGEAAANYLFRKNASDLSTRRTNLELDVELNFDQGLPLVFGDTLDAVVEHLSTGHTKDFNFYIYGK